MPQPPPSREASPTAMATNASGYTIIPTTFMEPPGSGPAGAPSDAFIDEEFSFDTDQDTDLDEEVIVGDDMDTTGEDTTESSNEGSLSTASDTSEDTDLDQDEQASALIHRVTDFHQAVQKEIDLLWEERNSYTPEDLLCAIEQVFPDLNELAFIVRDSLEHVATALCKVREHAEELEAEREDLEEAQDEHIQRAEGLKDKMRKLEAANSTIQQENLDLAASIKKLKEERALDVTTQRQVREMRSDLEAYKRELDAEAKVLKERELSIDLQQNKFNRMLAKELAKVDKMQTELAKGLAAFEEEKAAFHQLKEAFEQETAAFAKEKQEQETASKVALVGVFAEERDKLIQKEKELEMAIQSHQSAAQQLDKARETLVADNKDLSTRVEMLQHHASEQSASISALRKELQVAATQRAQNFETIQSTQSRLDAKEEECRALVSKINALSEQNEALAAKSLELAWAKNDMAVAQAELQEQREEFECERTELEMAKHNVEEEKKRLAQERKAADEKSDHLLAKEHQVVDVRVFLLRKREEEVERKKRVLGDKQSELIDQSEELEKRERDLEKSEDQLKKDREALEAQKLVVSECRVFEEVERLSLQQEKEKLEAAKKEFQEETAAREKALSEQCQKLEAKERELVLRDSELTSMADAAKKGFAEVQKSILYVNEHFVKRADEFISIVEEHVSDEASIDQEIVDQTRAELLAAEESTAEAFKDIEALQEELRGEKLRLVEARTRLQQTLVAPAPVVQQQPRLDLVVSKLEALEDKLQTQLAVNNLGLRDDANRAAELEKHAREAAKSLYRKQVRRLKDKAAEKQRLLDEAFGDIKVLVKANEELHQKVSALEDGRKHCALFHGKKRARGDDDDVDTGRNVKRSKSASTELDDDMDAWGPPNYIDLTAESDGSTEYSDSEYDDDDETEVATPSAAAGEKSVTTTPAAV